MAGASHEVLKEESVQAVPNLTKFLEASVQMDSHLAVNIEICVRLVEWRWGSRRAVRVVVFRHGINLPSDVTSIYWHGLASYE